MAPETHTRYRVQRLIRLGEWLERNTAGLALAADVISEAHDMLIDPPEDMPCSDVVELAGAQQMQAVILLNKLMQELRFDVPTRDVKRGADVTLHHPLACAGREYQVVIEAPKPDVPTQQEYNIEEQERLKAEHDAMQDDIPSQEEFARVRSQVDITN